MRQRTRSVRFYVPGNASEAADGMDSRFLAVVGFEALLMEVVDHCPANAWDGAMAQRGAWNEPQSRDLASAARHGAAGQAASMTLDPGFCRLPRH